MRRTFLPTSLLVAVVSLLLTTLAMAQTTKSPLENLPYSGGVLMTRAIHAGRVQVGTSANMLSPTNLACSPAPCTLPTSQASPGPSPANEVPIVVNPRNPSILLTGANDYDCSNIQGFYVSTDAGTTWNHTCMSTAAGLSFGAGDPGVAFDSAGKTAYISGLDFTPSGGIDAVYEKSTNNGSTWSAAKIAVTPLFASGQSDKDWLQIDTTSTSPFKDCIYISTTQFDPSSNSTIAVAHSCNGGTSWTNVQVDTKQIFPSAVDQFSDLAIGADGTVYATWLNCPASGSAGDCGGTVSSIRFSKSSDGGNTWSTPSTVTKVRLVPDGCLCAFYGSLPNTSERVSEVPAVAIDNSTGSHKGTLYVIYYSYNTTAKQMKVFVSNSTDGGTTWSKGVPVSPASATHDQFFPWVTVSRSGAVGATWMDRRNDPNNLSWQPFDAISFNGGANFGTNHALTPNLSNPNNDGFGGTFMGDYAGNFFSGNTLYASWTDTSNGSTGQDVVGGFDQ